MLTSKHIYFQGEDKKRFRVRLDKLVSAEAAADGFLFQRDGVRARPEAFVSYDVRILAVLLHWLEDPEPGTSVVDVEAEPDEMLDALAASEANSGDQQGADRGLVGSRHRVGVRHSACDEEPDELHGREACRQDGTRRSEVCAGRQYIVDDRDEGGFRSDQGLVDSVPILDLRRSGSRRTLVHGGGALRLDDDVADVRRPARPDGPQHPRHPVVVERVVARLRWRDRHERHRRRVRTQCATERSRRALYRHSGLSWRSSGFLKFKMRLLVGL